MQDNYLESLDHQHCSLAQVQHDLMGGQALFNTAVSIQSTSASDHVDDSSISFDPVAAHDPSEVSFEDFEPLEQCITNLPPLQYAVTVNIRTVRGDEGVVLRYWSDFLSDNQANELAIMLARIMDHFVTKPYQYVEDLDVTKSASKPQEPQSQAGEVQVEKPQVEQPSLFNSEEQLRTMVSSCVQEVLEQLFKSGALVSTLR